jgi:RND family efflux transporter MFP subunit
MRPCILLLTVLVVLAGCKPEDAPVEARLVRTLVVNPQPIGENRHAIGEVKPRYESDLSFRVAGKVLSRLVDIGASVKQGDTLATLDTQDYQNRLRSAEADVNSADAALVEAQGAEGRQAKLLKDGWTTRATYDTVLRNLRTAEAKLAAAKANLDLTRDQLHYTELKADFDGVITAVGAEAGQNVNAGQMVVRLARPDDRDGVFNIAETAFTNLRDPHPEVVIWALSNPELTVEGVVREVSPVADPATRTYTVKVTLKNPPPQIRFGMSIGGRLKGHAALAVALPLSAVFEKNCSPAV